MSARVRNLIAIVGGLALIACVGVIWIRPEVGLKIALTAALVGPAAVLFATRRSFARSATKLGAIDQRLEKHHKRSSEWDWRINERLTSAGIRVADRPVAAQSSKKSSATWKNHPLSGRLVQMEILDHEYYAAASGASFQRARDAADHFLSVGITKLHSPSPFVDAESLPEDIRLAMKFGRVNEFLDFWSSERLWTSQLGELFDPRAIGDIPAAQTHPGGPVGWFQSQMTEESTLVVTPEDPRSGVFAQILRRQILEHLETVRESRKLAGPRESSIWDSAREKQWRASVDSAQPGVSTTVSIILPVRDRESTISAAIDSVLAQSFSQWELIVVDDGSTDRTRDIIAEYSVSDSRIKGVSNDGGQGVSGARNIGLTLATGDYLAFLDSDNTWRFDYLDMMVRGLINSGERAAHAGSRVVADQGKATTYRAYEGGYEQLRLLNHIDMNVLVVDRELALSVGGFDESLRRWVDHDFALRVAKVASIPLFPIIACDYDNSSDLADRITLRESNHWQWVVLGKAWVDWTSAASAPRVPGRVSVVIPTYNDADMTIRAMRSVLEDSSWEDIEVVVVDNGSNPDIARRLYMACVGRNDVRYRRLPRNLNFAIGSNFGAAESTGEYVLFLNNDTFIRRGGIGPLVDRIRRGDAIGVQALLVYDDDLIQTAGTIFPVADALPMHLLTGHPVEDAAPVGALPFAAVTAAAFLLRAETIIAAQGFDPFYVNGMEDVDLCLRLRATHSGMVFAVETASIFTHLESKTPGRSKNQSENRRIFLDRWRGALPAGDGGHLKACGFEIASIGIDRSPVLAPRIQLTRSAAARRRWGIKIAANAGKRGDGWGDSHFAESLNTALRALGQDPVTYRHGTHDAEASRFDDVVLAIRGLDRVQPHPGKLNILWVISHPELVTPEEVLEFDIVCAASGSWAQRMQEITGKKVNVLLQATDTSRFSPPSELSTRSGRGVFVGGVHAGRERRVVTDVLALGAPVTVYGPGWEGTVPNEVFGGWYVPNGELAEVYRGASFVLADHWEDMAAQGFIQNRIFDAVSAGARVLSDKVDGIEELFGGAVRSYSTLGQLQEVMNDVDGCFVDDEELLAIAVDTAFRHSFDARAACLIGLVEGEFTK